jgi:hypothetical protein
MAEVVYCLLKGPEFNPQHCQKKKKKSTFKDPTACERQTPI